MSLFRCKNCEELKKLLDKSLKQTEDAQEIVKGWEDRCQELTDKFKEAVDYNEKLIKENILLRAELRVRN